MGTYMGVIMRYFDPDKVREFGVKYDPENGLLYVGQDQALVCLFTSEDEHGTWCGACLVATEQELAECMTRHVGAKFFTVRKDQLSDCRNRGRVYQQAAA